MPRKKSKPAERKLDTPGDIAATGLEAFEKGQGGYKAHDAALDLVLAALHDKPCPKCGGPRFKNNGIVVASDGSKFRLRDKLDGDHTAPVGQKFRRFALERVTP